jgi:prolipoprotein diacylglyceryltransferase
MTDMLALLIEPLVLSRWQNMALLLPLCLAISVVYKTTKCADVRQIPMAALVNFVTVVVMMYVIGAALLLLYEWVA